MIPKTLSASAAQVYEACPARYKAEYIDRVPDMSSSAADLGTACHAALEMWVKDGYYLRPDLKVLLNLFTEAYDLIFEDRERYDEGKDMMVGWYERTDLLDGREILSTELKTNFPLPTSAGVIPITYIFDRCDWHVEDRAIEVIDYKTVALPIPPEDLAKRIQPRVYAMAAAIQFKNLQPDSIWVSYDLLRYDLVGRKFTRADNIATWEWLKGMAERIIADDGTAERLNPECRWCVRKAVCETLTRHISGGGALMYDSLPEAVDRRALLTYAKGAVDAQIRDLDEFIMAEAEKSGLFELSTETTDVTISMSSRREIDSERAAKVLSPEMFSRYGTLPIGAVDKILKDGNVDPEVKKALKGLIRKKPTSPRVNVKPRSVVETD